MADNQRQIKGTVDIDVEPSLKALRELKRQLKETAAGTDEFRKLQEQINDTEDALRSARTGADNFAEILGTLPGPIGNIGSQLGGTVATLKQFSAIKLTDLRSSVADFGKDLLDVAKNFGNLTGITKIYTTLNNALSRSFVAVGVGEQAAAAGARTFAAALTATGIGAIIVGLGLLIANWDKVTDAITGATAESKTYEEAQAEVTKGLADFNKKLKDVENTFKAAREGTISKEAALKKYNETLGSTVGYAGSLEQAEQLMAANTEVVIESIKLRAQAQVFYAKSAEAAAKALSGEAFELSYFEKGLNIIKSGGNTIALAAANAQSMAENYGKAIKDQNTFEKEGDLLTQKAIENDKKLKKGLAEPPDYSKAKQEDKSYIEELEKNRRAAELALKADKDREIEIVKDNYKKQIELAEKHKKDTTLLREAQAKEIKEIEEKYALKDRQKLFDDETKALELKNAQGLIKESEYQKQLFDLAVKYDINKADAQIKYAAFQKAEKKKELDDERALSFAKLQNVIDELDKENAAREDDYQQDQIRLEIKRGKLKEQEKIELANTELTEKEKNDIVVKYANLDKQIDEEKTKSRKAEEEARRAIALQYADVAGQLGAVLQQAAGDNKALAIAGLVIEQAAGVARIIINTQAAAAKAGYLTPVGIATLAAGALGVASAVIATKKGIDQIKAQQIPGGKSSSVSVAGGTPPTFTGGPNVAAPQIQTGQQVNPTTQIAQTLSQTTGRPIQAYVVSQQISSAQAFDRRTNVAATMG